MTRLLATALHRAARRLARTPGFTALVVGLLATVLAVLLTLTSAASAMLWRGLPYPAAERLVVVQGFAAQMQASIGFAPGLLDELAALDGVEAVGAWDYAPDLFDAQGGRYRNARVDPALVAMLGGRPQLGRVLSAEDGADAVVLSADAWRGRFGADPAIVGRVIDFDGTPLRVIGVMQDGFRFPERSTALWRPLQLTPAQRSGAEAFNFGAVQAWLRLAPGHALPALREALAVRLGTRPELDAMRKFMGLELRADALRDTWDRGRSRQLALLAGAAGALLLLLLANVGSLFLARGLERAGELALSSALGASPRRLALERVGEGVLATGMAVTLALLAVQPGLRVLEAFDVLDASLPSPPGVDGVTWLVAAGAWIVLAAALSLVPVWMAQHPRALALLGHGARSVGGSRRAQRARRGLVAVQVGVAVTLLGGAALLSRSVWELLAQDLGFAPEHVSLAMLETRQAGHGADAAALAAVRATLAATPGIQAVSVANAPPFSFSESVASATLDDPARSEVRVHQRDVDLDYFAALGLPVQRGRGFAAGDGAPDGGGVIVDRRFAELHFPAADALGARLGQSRDGRTQWSRIVGIVPTVKHAQLDEQAGQGTLYRLDAWPAPSHGRATLVLRSEIPREALARTTREAAAAAGLRLADFASLPQRLRDTLQTRMPLTALTVAFALVGTALAALGLFALVTFSVQRRLPEFGVRLALGAPPSALRALALREGLRAAGPGLVVGLAGALAVGRVLSSHLYRVSWADPQTLVAVLAGACGVVLLACAGPARRAAKLDPASTLRHY